MAYNTSRIPDRPLLPLMIKIPLTLLLIVFCVTSCKQETDDAQSNHAHSHYTRVKYNDPYILDTGKNLLKDYAPTNADGTVNVVVEIPAGTIQKWEVSKPRGLLEWEFKNDKPRVVQYLPYPGNYGMIPRTLLPKEKGGDGDPLDVIVLGPAVERGTIVKAKIIGVLRLLDNGEQDDKLIAVLSNSPLADVDSIASLNRDFVGISQIVETWFANYKGPGKMKTLGYAESSEALQILKLSVEEFKE